MKTLLGGLLAVALFGAGLDDALALDKVAIRVQKKQDTAAGAEKTGSANAWEAQGGEAVHYEFTVENLGLADLPQLTISYVIFVERPKLGARVSDPAHVDRIAGSKTLDVLSNHAPQTIASNPFKLAKKDVVGGFTYLNGGRMKADDNVVGVWVRVSQNGQVIGELTQPPNVTKRGWDSKESSDKKTSTPTR